MEQEIFIEGIKCAGCANTVKEKFESIEGVDAVSVDIESKKAVVFSQERLNTDSFVSALSDTNYKIVE